MADYRYNVMNNVDGNEIENIGKLLRELKGEDTCTIIIDHVDQINSARVLGVIDEEEFEVYTRGINEDDTQFVIKRRH